MGSVITSLFKAKRESLDCPEIRLSFSRPWRLDQRSNFSCSKAIFQPSIPKMFLFCGSSTVFVSGLQISGGQFCSVGSKTKNLENTPTLSCWSLDERSGYTFVKNLIADNRSELSALAKYLLFLAGRGRLRNSKIKDIWPMQKVQSDCLLSNFWRMYTLISRLSFSKIV